MKRQGCTLNEIPEVDTRYYKLARQSHLYNGAV
jgi:hypothetical protein